jgi:hypothetical protein
VPGGAGHAGHDRGLEIGDAPLPKDSPANGTSARVVRLMSGS